MLFPRKRLVWAFVALSVASCDSRQSRIEVSEQKLREAAALHDSGEYERAAILGEEALKDLAGLLGPDHLSVIRHRYELSDYYEDAGRRDESIAEARLMLASAVRTLGEANEESHHALLRLASVLSQVNNAEGNVDRQCAAESEALYQLVLETAQKGGSAAHHLVLDARKGLGVLYQRMERNEDAVKHLTLVLESQRVTLGAEHQETLETRMNLAAGLMAMQLFEAAQTEFQIVYDLRKSRLGEEHPKTIQAKDWLGNCIADQGRLEEAIPLITDVWNSKRRVLGDSHRGTLAAGFNLATAQLKGGYRDEAIRTLNTIHGYALKALGPTDSQTQMYQAAIEMVK
jgi:hypothetical protein